ncbi:MAG TPA: RluA family pseudouridine synthase [Stellaceae bacterium]|jgi:23S rRNA pseudouridine1911/1915/1917 synthase|nr:RluA family pseudouridine synthase [Stellaceae bacterium]
MELAWTKGAETAREQITVAETETGERLDRILAAHLATLSRSRLKKLIETGQVSLDDETINDPSMRVKGGQVFIVDLPAPVADRPEPQAMALDIVYEDNQLLVLDKPAGLVVHPAPGNPDHTLVNALLAHCGDSLAGIGGVKRPGIVHRIDKDTSGLMLVAKTDLAHQKLSADFAAHTLTRSYLAVVRGVPSPRAGTIATRLGRSRANRKKMAVVTSGGKEAVTHYRVQRAVGLRAALVECRLATGRTHQIRVHMTDIGHPLIGDQTYGRGRTSSLPEAARAFPRQALHANVIGFNHPLSGDYLEFTSPLPPDMVALIAALERG